MIVRQHIGDGQSSSAVYSDCETYRYELTRQWQSTAPRLLFVMLNPSTATEAQSDPTVGRCERRARQMGFGAFRVVNLFGFRATDPRDLRQQGDPVGPDNDQILVDSVTQWRPDQVICAWGAYGTYRNRGDDVCQMLRAKGVQLWHLGLTASGQPRHPLYLPFSRAPDLWSGAPIT